ncbi:hypothetical protein NLJ89_g6898 [Agrocybe chaxingu]|uniref:DUF7223 domain-containing protein n=1 Tax=Agrocybe chaxingu TaxID=84603 RepID=A0A9W8JXE2_9AGAR|nr:hypothetical protein NLJ89_g6898 [Agrocybe chaxingu]
MVRPIKKLNTFDVEKSGNVLDVGVDKNFNLIDESLDCPPVAASIKVDVGASATAAVALGVAVSGTIIPPLIDDFAIISTLNADLQGNLTVNAGVTGTLDSGKILLFEAAIPGLNFPGILTIGPSFQLNAQAKASLDLNLGMTVGISYKIDKAELVFPPNSERASNGTFTIRDTPLQLSASPNIAATGTLEAHLIPGVNLGISALGGVVGAGVFLDIDGQAFMKLNLEASANGEVVVKPAKKEKIAMRGITSPGHYYWNRAAALDPSDIAIRSPEPAPEAAALATRQTNVSTSASTSFGGCFEIGAGLDVNVGANADFFGLFNPETSISLFTQRFELFKRCFGDSVSTKREVPSLPYHRRSFSRFGARAPRSVTPVPVFKRGVLDLLCPANLPAAVSVTEDTITAAEIKKV